jgi:dienelactone hydrolase
LPDAPGPHPAVVMLPGSGPMDRDESIGRNKPFKDIAWGLASRGIAVLRFDKVTLVHPGELDETFTADDEYVPHALAAAELLRGRDDVARVFVLGHSLGGTMAPRIAAAEPSIAGLIILAGATQPLHWAAVRQLRYLDQHVDEIVRQAQNVDSPDLSTATPNTDLPFGVPAAYWLSLRGYDAPALAASLHKPILVLQGGRDYQITVADDLVKWQEALDGTIKVYDADNHLFFTGSGPSKPAEYERAQHVDPAVVADIADWLTGPS